MQTKIKEDVIIDTAKNNLRALLEVLKPHFDVIVCNTDPFIDCH